MSGISERNPFVGPRPIQQGEELHGRDTEVRELYNRLQARRIVVLHSPSGAGKSSLVQAGLIPRLTAGGYDVWKPIRVNLDPDDLEGIPAGTNRYLLSAIVSLEDELPEANRRSPAELAGLDLCGYVKTRPRRKSRSARPVVLIFDQFEEVLTVAPLAVDAKRAFFAAVGRALETETYWALFLIREDHLGAFAPYHDQIPTQMSNTFRLDLMGLAGARAAAKNLAEQGGRSFPAVDQLVRDLSRVQVQRADGSFVAEQGLYVEPVQLQVVCRRLWDAMPADDLSIDPEDIAAYASVSESLGGYYADTVRTIAGDDDALERALRDWIGHKLIVGGIRSQVRQEPGKTAGLDNRLLARLLDSYLVRMEQRAGAHWFELSHDRLVEPIQLDNKAWEAKHLHPLQVQARLWEDARRPGALLLGTRALAGADAWAKDHPALLTEGEREFLEQSRDMRFKELTARRRLVILATVAGLVAVVVAVLGSMAWVARGQAVAALVRARDASLMAGARELAARGQTAPVTRLLLAVKEPGEVRGWHELAREILASLVPHLTLRGHRGKVAVAVWSPDGRRILTASADRTARVWNADGTGVPVVLGHGRSVSFAAWSPDGLHVLTASGDRRARVWNADGTGMPVVLGEHENPITSAAWSPDGLRILTASRDMQTRVWQADGTGTPVVLSGHAEAVMSAAWSPDGLYIATASEDRTMRVWRADGTGTPVVLEHDHPVDSVAWSPDGRRIAVLAGGRAARVCNADGTGAPVVLVGHTGRIDLVAWSPDGLRVVTASADDTARVWNADGSGKVVILKGHEDSVGAAAWSPDGLRILTASADRTARLWNADGSGEPVVLKGHEDRVDTAVWSPDGRHILTASHDQTARVWLADRTGVPVVRHKNMFLTTVWSPDRQRIVTLSFDKMARVWHADGTEEAVVLEGHAAKVSRAAWSPDGQRVLTASQDHTARVWRADGTGVPVVFAGHEDSVTAVAWSPDGQRILTASRDRTARVWLADEVGALVVLGGHEEGIHAAAWSPDGQRVATASSDRTARVWPADGTGVPIILGGHEDRVSSVVWSPDGRRIATVSDDRTARVWRADGTGELGVLRGHEEACTSAAWSPDGQRILTVSDDETARVWSADGTGEPVVLKVPRGAFNSATWSPDGRYILTASSDKLVRVWKADGTGEPLVVGGPVSVSATWSRDGHHILTLSLKGTVRRWIITTTELARALEDATTDCLTPEMRLTYLDETDAESRAAYEDCERSHGRVPFERSHDPPEGEPETTHDEM